MTKAGSTPLLSALISCRPENALLLLQRGAKVNVKQRATGHTPLMAATYNRLSERLIKEMLSRGADVNAKNNDGMTALMFAADWANLPVVQRLLAAGANVHIRNKEGETALHRAKQEEKKPMFGAVARPYYRRIIKLLRQAAKRK